MPRETVESLIEDWPTIEGIPWAEVTPTSPEEELRNDGNRAVRSFFVPWEDRHEWAAAWLGFPQVLGDEPKYISRRLPQFHPDYTDPFGEPYLWATQVQKCEPYGIPDDDGDGGAIMRSVNDVALYAFARVQVLYETLTYDLLEDDEITEENGVPDESYLDRYVTIQSNPSGELLTLPIASIVYVDGANPATVVPQTTMRNESKYDIELIWHLVPEAAIGMRFINPGADSFPIDDAINKVNSTEFMGCPQGTLLLTAVQPKRIRSALGATLWDLTFRFVYLYRGQTGADVPAGEPDRAIGHQFILQFSSNLLTWRELVANPAAAPATSNYGTLTAGKSLYDWADFHTCLRVPA